MIKKNVTIRIPFALISLFLLGRLSYALEVPSLLTLTSFYIATKISLKKKDVTHLIKNTHSFPHSEKTRIAETLLYRCENDKVVFDPATHLGVTKDKVLKITYAYDYMDVLYEKKIPHISKDPVYATENIRTFLHYENKHFKPIFQYYDAANEEGNICFALNEKYILIGDYNVLTVLNRNHEILRSYTTNMWHIETIVPIKGREQEFYVINADRESHLSFSRYDASLDIFFGTTSLEFEGIADIHIIDSGRHTIIHDRYNEGCRSCYIGCTDNRNFLSHCKPLYSRVCHACVSDNAKYAAFIMNFTKEQCMLKIIDLDSLKIDRAMSLHEITLTQKLSRNSKCIFLSEHADGNVLAVGGNQRINLFKCPEGTPVLGIGLFFSIKNMHANKNNLFIENQNRTISRYPFWLLHVLIDYVQ